MKELEFGGPVSKGSRGTQVKRVQEWLTLGGFAVKVDSDFGGATEAAVKKFQQKKKLPANGAVDQSTFDALAAPMLEALKPIPANGKPLSQLIIAYGRQHAKQWPREVGGPNCGPWVRLYMDGHEGAPWFWCAGFATFVIRQAADTLKVPMPVLRSFGVANIAADAKARKRFLHFPGLTDRKKIGPGSLFLEEGGPTGYLHTGIVVGVLGDAMNTIEGNTNDDGSSNGFEVIARTRGFNRMDFALV